MNIVRARMTSAEFWAWLVALVSSAYWLNVIRTSQDVQSPTLGSVIRWAADAGSFNIAAWLLIGMRANRIERAGPITFPSIAAGVVLGAVCVIPARQATVVALAGLLALLLSSPRITREGRDACSLILGLLIAMIWSSVYFVPLHIIVAAFDAKIIGEILTNLGWNIAVHGNIVANHDAGLDIEILTACTSSIQFAEVVLGFLVVKIYLGSRLTRADLPWLFASLGASVALTEMRLSLMATSEASFYWWHDGTGVTIYEMAALLAALVFPLAAWIRGPEGSLGAVGGAAT